MAVIANLSMSLDGFIADRDDGVVELFGWYGDGPVEVVDFGGRVFRMREPSAAYFRDGARDHRRATSWAGGCTTTPTAGNAKPPSEAPMVVVTHDPPDDWPRDGVPITFATSIEEGVAEARRLAGDRAVGGGGRPHAPASASRRGCSTRSS